MTVQAPEPVTTTQVDVMASLTAEEILAARAIVVQHGGIDEHTRYVYVGLIEPSKGEVIAYENGTGPKPDRVVRMMLLQVITGLAHDIRISLTSGTILKDERVDGTRGHLPILEEEFTVVEEVLRDSDKWKESMQARGLDPAKVVVCPLSAGFYGNEGGASERILRCFGFYRESEEDSVWARPIDGVCAYVDPIGKVVREIVEYRHFPVPEETANFHLAEYRGEELKGLKPIEITQPEGPSFVVDGSRVEWANWKFGISFDAREGLILRQLTFRDNDVDRPIMFRGSIAEMVVPYADPAPTRYWQNYFDTGEYLFGRFTNSLQLGCDCLGEIHYFDATLSDELGNPRTIQNAICMHEEDFGTLWKHTDMFTGSTDVRRQRRLVISFFTTVGNYDYGFYWYLYLDGTIECESKLTGVLFPSAYPGEGYAHASEVAPGVGAPYHQHLFSARLDMMIDGIENTVLEVDAARTPIGPDNVHGNAFTNIATTITSEDEGGRMADASAGRTWQIVNPNKTNRLGKPTGYALYPTQTPTLLADPSAGITERATFTTKHLWVSAYDPEERYPAGDLVNQNPGGDGLPSYMSANRNLDNSDVVLWHTFGLTHFPRPEDWPVMPVDYAKFTLKPHGFFDRNPALNVPATTSNHCCTESQ
ncbi:primary-amine oxidase [Rhodococcus sp. WS3]|uniref:primary-amine oxidase n=1 Tax=unclassified Rhodococcus (in: high G+C Gram-positive bacteria) TaxID=192944 RepID=UPI0005D3A0A4|nr:MULTISPECIES: primary-amine oxidase [unclassified Rhodococcus (in: high G+C Gram-positive bacteria)]KJF19252.1 Histamine oxidase [Rhodococcus sp. AD45]ROZ42780.1 primary-amine oxidase [Rhodococcus sp. WS3]RZL20967.1 MAG: primary-amine oxidase [Rhodococcus sp. (in: high G+C Gram-positive bacteria)]